MVNVTDALTVKIKLKLSQLIDVVRDTILAKCFQLIPLVERNANGNLQNITHTNINLIQYQILISSGKYCYQVLSLLNNNIM